jgi:hypothetical protein
MDPGAERLLDLALPRWDVRERHGRLVAAPAERVWAALQQVTVGELRLTRALMRVRSLGRYEMGDPGRLMLDMLPPGEISRREPAELVCAMVSPTTPLRPMTAGPQTRPGDVAELSRPLPDGWVRVAMDFRLEGDGAATRLTTETRVLATGPRARRSFGAYWLLIRAGSGLIRREILRAVAHRAEAAGA